MIINSVRYRRLSDTVSLTENDNLNKILFSGEPLSLNFTYTDTSRNPGATLEIFKNSIIISSEQIENNAVVSETYSLTKGYYVFDVVATNVFDDSDNLQYRVLYDFPDIVFITSEYHDESNGYIVTGHTYTLNGNKQFEIPPYSDGISGLMPIKKIAAGAFSNFLRLTSVIIPETVEFIGATAFAFCRNLAEVVFLSETPPVLDGNFVFQDSEYLTIARVPIEYIDNYTSLASDPNSPWHYFNGKIASL
jgi:hypothetical protein